MPYPDDRQYADTHEWHKRDGDTLTLGLTQHAVDSLTDITYVEMKGIGESLDPGDSVGEVESVKTTSDVYCACAGEIVEVNERLADDPGLLNSDPHGEGWLIKVKITDDSGLSGLVDAGTYESEHAS
ncbi:MAG: glycine cleavage system protein GcvH [Planctomycetota bacterium]